MSVYHSGWETTLQKVYIQLFFISNACDYVTDNINNVHSNNQSDDDSNRSLLVIVSFSFVNTEMRVEYRKRFPTSSWILVDTTKDLAEERILSREGHFYKGSGGGSNADNVNGGEDSDPTTETKVKENDLDNSEWDFQAVDFPHIALDGSHDVDTNAKKVIDSIQSLLSTS